MPQLNKGGKYVFGWSVIGAEGTIHFPTMALSEYNLTSDPEIIIFTGSKITGGFCVTNQRMLSSSKLKHIIDDLPELTGTHSINAGQFIPYKGRNYAWLPLSKEGTVQLPKQTLKFLNINAGDRLMSIRSSDIAFTMGATSNAVGAILSVGICDTLERGSVWSCSQMTVHPQESRSSSSQNW